MSVSETDILKVLCADRATDGVIDGKNVIACCLKKRRPVVFGAESISRRFLVENFSKDATLLVVKEFAQISPSGVCGIDGPPNGIWTDVESGIAGALVTGPEILSCSHVLCAAGTTSIDVTDRDCTKVGEVSRCGSLAAGCSPAPFVNRFDAALATYERRLGIAEYDHMNTIVPAIGARVSHMGHDVARKSGVVVNTGLIVRVNAGGDKFLYRDQILVIDGDRPFAGNGDSGSLVVDEESRPVGLIHAVSAAPAQVMGYFGRLTVVCPIDPVLDFFGVTLLPYHTVP